MAIFGNFVNRAVVLTHKYFDGKVPARGTLEPVDSEVLAQIPELRSSLERNFEGFHFREALKDAMSIARLGNKYISDTEPWKVIKTDRDRAATILNISLQICCDLALAFEPFTPFAAERLRGMLHVGLAAGFDHRPDRDGAAQHTVLCPSPVAGDSDSAAPSCGTGICLDWSMFGSADMLPAGHALGEAELLFAKVEDDAIEAQTARLAAIKAEREAAAAAEAAKKAAPLKPECSYEDFDKMDIRTATVLDAERVPKTDKLLKLTIDTGLDRRVIVSGIAEYYSPEDMKGRQICILANLRPRTIRGIESKGMILMARQGDGKMRFITPQEVLADGSQIN